MRRIALSLACALIAGPGLVSIDPSPSAGAGQAEPSATVTHYDAYVEPDLLTQRVKGRVTLTVGGDPDAGTLTLSRGALEIDSVVQNGRAVPFQVNGRSLTIALDRPDGGGRRVTVAYHGAPTFGLVFAPERRQIYTLFSTSQWMVAIDAPDARATLDLAVAVPGGLAALATGDEIRRRPLATGVELVEWRLTRPSPTYTFGFALGDFATTTTRAGQTTLRYAGSGFTNAQLGAIFKDTPAMIAFFAERAGLPYPGAEYAQALVTQTAGQEMTGLSLFSEEYGHAVLADPSAISLIAHELAHQWWGNLVTNRAFTHFWLNEGFATFMAAAFRESRFGRDAYLAEVAAMRTRYERVRDAGRDRSLIFPDWNRPTADDRTLVYQKGGYVLHLLREELGEERFWNGIRDYTRRFAGASVTTTDFQQAMAQSSGRDLSRFFARWVLTAP